MDTLHMLMSQDAKARSDNGYKPKTRERLIVAAIQLFQQRGYHGAGTTDILELARSPRGSMYHHFPGGKEDLGARCAEWLAAGVVTSIQALRLKGLKPENIIAIYIDNMMTWLQTTHFSEGPLLAALTNGVGNKADNVLARALTQAYKDIQNEFTQMLTVAGHSQKNAEEVSRAVIMNIEGGTILARATRDTEVLEEAKQRLVTLIKLTGKQ